MLVKPLELPPAFVPPSIAQVASKTLYENQPLRSERNEIRLIRFLFDESLSPPRPSRDGPLECTMETVSLDDQSLKHSALSYCWGPPDFDHEVSCNGHSIAVTMNVSLALLSVRRRLPSAAIWVDQLCINQSDLEERRSQLLLMRRIFSKCEYCFCHIGEYDLQFEVAILYISHWLRKSGKMVHEHLYKFGNDTNYDEFIGEDATKDFAGINALLEAAARPYFARTWIIQETAVAPSKLLTCGPMIIPFDDFINVFVDRVMPQLTKGMFEKFGAFSFSEASKVMQRVSSLVSYYYAASHQSLPDASGNKLIILATAGREYAASDPRDRIFALQGIAEDGHDFPAPDYTRTVEEIYLQFAETCCARGYGLYCIKEAAIGTGSYDLPS